MNPTDQQFRPGDLVICRDARDGAHFLVVGDVYTVAEVDDRGWLLLRGMARMWEPARFERPPPGLHWPDTAGDWWYDPQQT